MGASIPDVYLFSWVHENTAKPLKWFWAIFPSQDMRKTNLGNLCTWRQIVGGESLRARSRFDDFVETLRSLGMYRGEKIGLVINDHWFVSWFTGHYLGNQCCCPCCILFEHCVVLKAFSLLQKKQNKRKNLVIWLHVHISNQQFGIHLFEYQGTWGY
jgi:hypothetical protein